MPVSSRYADDQRETWNIVSEAQLVKALQIQTKLGAYAKEVPQDAATYKQWQRLMEMVQF